MIDMITGLPALVTGRADADAEALQLAVEEAEELACWRKGINHRLGEFLCLAAHQRSFGTVWWRS